MLVLPCVCSWLSDDWIVSHECQDQLPELAWYQLARVAITSILSVLDIARQSE